MFVRNTVKTEEYLNLNQPVKFMSVNPFRLSAAFVLYENSIWKREQQHFFVGGPTCLLWLWPNLMRSSLSMTDRFAP